MRRWVAHQASALDMLASPSVTLACKSLSLRIHVHLRKLSALAKPLNPSHSRGPTHPPLLNETIGSAFRKIVSRSPSSAAVSSVHQRLHWTYQQLSDAVDAAAQALIAAGVQRGDRVGILSPNKSVAAAAIRDIRCRVCSHKLMPVWSGWSCSCQPRRWAPFSSTLIPRTDFSLGILQRANIEA
jgi:non-ribosomal peptide synthetase component F